MVPLRSHSLPEQEFGNLKGEYTFVKEKGMKMHTYQEQETASEKGLTPEQMENSGHHA